jgi:hypothetical protein
MGSAVGTRQLCRFSYELWGERGGEKRVIERVVIALLFAGLRWVFICMGRGLGVEEVV